jgi:hypothetical protein
MLDTTRRKLLNWQAVGFEEGLRKTIEYGVKPTSRKTVTV